MHRLMEFDQQLLAATEVHEISMLSHLHSERPATDEINTVDLSSYKGKCQTHSWRPYRACACTFRTDNTENAPLRSERSTASQCGQKKSLCCRQNAAVQEADVPRILEETDMGGHKQVAFNEMVGSAESQYR